MLQKRFYKSKGNLMKKTKTLPKNEPDRLKNIFYAAMLKHLN